MRSRLYNRLAWATRPEDYRRFAWEAICAADGPVLEVAWRAAAATAALHAASARPTVLVDVARGMLEQAARNVAEAGGGDAVGSRIRLMQGDLRTLTFPPHGFTTVLGLGLTHLFDHVPAVVAALREQLTPGGRLYLSGLVGGTRRGRRYLHLLHRAGEVATPLTAAELHARLGRPDDFRTAGCMAYATLPPRSG